MTNSYYQLTLAQRYKIEAYLESAKTQTEIAKLIGVNKSTISRELKRNTPQRGKGAKIYVASKAQIKTENRHMQKHKHSTFSEPLKL